MKERTALHKPDWIKVRLGRGEGHRRLHGIVGDGKLHTVCQEALCPNMGRCWEHGRATLMILGDTCTRGCRFCNVGTGHPGTCDTDEPRRVAEAVKAMVLKDVVITSVTRDDLPDGGASVWVETIEHVRAACPGVLVEVLIPDFRGSDDGLARVLAAKPDVLGHNLETVPDLYPAVRPQADYSRSLDVLRRAHAAGLVTKTGIMVGLGEAFEALADLMADARAAGCNIFYAGQYLQPTREHYPVQRYIEPEAFDRIAEMARKAGFDVVVAAPLVRSSYHSDEQAAFLAGSG